MSGSRSVSTSKSGSSSSSGSRSCSASTTGASRAGVGAGVGSGGSGVCGATEGCAVGTTAGGAAASEACGTAARDRRGKSAGWSSGPADHATASSSARSSSCRFAGPRVGLEQRARLCAECALSALPLARGAQRIADQLRAIGPVAQRRQSHSQPRQLAQRAREPRRVCCGGQPADRLDGQRPARAEQVRELLLEGARRAVEPRQVHARTAPGGAREDASLELAGRDVGQRDQREVVARRLGEDVHVAREQAAARARLAEEQDGAVRRPRVDRLAQRGEVERRVLALHLGAHPELARALPEAGGRVTGREQGGRARGQLVGVERKLERARAPVVEQTRERLAARLRGDQQHRRGYTPMCRKLAHEREQAFEHLAAAARLRRRHEQQQIGGRRVLERVALGRPEPRRAQLRDVVREDRRERGLLGDDPDRSHGGSLHES